ncbi:MAG: molybdopterin-dependent oxidoreductase [Pseudolabrys sp.]
MTTHIQKLSRRSFLVSSGAAGIAVTFGTLDNILPAEAAADFTANAWVSIGPDGIATIMSPAVEMGQGTLTALPACLAEDLNADWAKVHSQTAPDNEKLYGNPKFHGHMVTVASKAVDGYFEVMRLAGAQARKILVANAARILKVPESELTTEMSTVVHKKSGRKLGYGDIAKQAKMPDPMPKATKADLKPVSQFRYIGKDLARVDIPLKVNGSAKYGLDTQLPGMVYASVLHAPVQGEKAAKIDDKAAKAVKGVMSVHSLPNGVAVVGKTLEATMKGKAALKVTWTKSAKARKWSNDTLAAKYTKIAGDWSHKSVDMLKNGDADGAIGKAKKVLAADFVNDHVAHCAMEPLNATSLVKDGNVHLWTSNQSVIDMELAGSIAAGTKPNMVKVERPFLGGGFGRRTDWDAAFEATLLAKQMPGTPVKVVWSRQDDVMRDMYRPFAGQRIEVGLDENNNVVGWRHRIVAASYLARGIPPLFKALKGKDPVSAGNGDFRYAVPAQRVDYVRAQDGFQVGAWRGISAGYTKFAIESMVDELADTKGVDPLELRISLLKGHPRAIAVLKAVAEMANWKQKRPDGRAIGLGYSDALETHTAAVAEVSLDSKTGQIKVHHLWAAVDPGIAVQPKNVMAQMEGAMLFGLGAALKEQIHLKDGVPQESNFDGYHVNRMADVPPIEVKVISTNNRPTGIGEAGVPVVAPAIANAVARLTGGKRLRQLPMTPERVKQALRGA